MVYKRVRCCIECVLDHRLDFKIMRVIPEIQSGRAKFGIYRDVWELGRVEWGAIFGSFLRNFRQVQNFNLRLRKSSLAFFIPGMTPSFLLTHHLFLWDYYV